MKKYILVFALFLMSFAAAAQCAAGLQIGTLYSCDIQNTGTASLGIVNAGVWNASPVDVAHGGTGSTTLAGLQANIFPSQATHAGQYLQTNGSGTLSWQPVSFSASQIIAFLGYTPYNGATNPSNFLTSISAAQIAAALGYTPYNGATNPNGYLNQAGVRSSISLTTTGFSGAATYNPSTGILNIPNYAAMRYYHNGVLQSAGIAETFIGTVAGGAGDAIVYLTDNGLSTGNALYTNVNAIIPIVNNSNVNFTYGWTVSADKKTLTVNTKQSTGIFVSLLNLTLLGAPTNTPNGTVVSVTVIGN